MTDKQTQTLLKRIDHRFDEMDRKFDLLTDMVLDMKRSMVTKAELEEVKIDVRIIKHAVADLSEQVANHISDQRIHLPV